MLELRQQKKHKKKHIYKHQFNILCIVCLQYLVLLHYCGNLIQISSNVIGNTEGSWRQEDFITDRYEEDSQQHQHIIVSHKKMKKSLRLKRSFGLKFKFVNQYFCITSPMFYLLFPPCHCYVLFCIFFSVWLAKESLRCAYFKL